MKILRSYQLNMKKLDSQLVRYARSEGLIIKKPIETLIDYRVTLRPFRRVTFDIESSVTDEPAKVESFIDELLSPIVQDENHRMLLWRPKYIRIQTVEEDATENVKYDAETDAQIQEVIKQMLDLRWNGQALDEEYQPKLKRLQADPLSALGIIIPRSGGSLRKEQKLVDERKESHAYVLASSLISNTSPRDIITNSILGERLFVETILVHYESERDRERLLILETPYAKSIDDAVKAGKALTRLCELYVECRKRITNVPNSEN